MSGRYEDSTVQFTDQATQFVKQMRERLRACFGVCIAIRLKSKEGTGDCGIACTAGPAEASGKNGYGIKMSKSILE